MIVRSKINKILLFILCCASAAALFCGCQRQNSQENNSSVTPGAAENAVVNNVSENSGAENTSDGTAHNTSENNAVNNTPENNAINNTAGNTTEGNTAENSAVNNTSETLPADNTANAADPSSDPAAGFRSTHSELSHTDNYTVYGLSFERDGMTIRGQLYLPNECREKYPLVIASHGFNGSFRLNSYINESFANAGSAVCAFDFCGGSTFSLSDGSILDMSVLTEVEDLQAVFDGLRSMEFIDSDNIFLMGESQGGMVSALLAARRPKDVAGLVLFYPAFVIPDNGRSLYGMKENIPEYAYAFKVRVGRRYYLDTIEMDPYEEIRGYEGDVLMIHGDQDVVVPYSYSQRALEVYKNAELITIKGSNHGFTGRDLADACNASVSFINSHLKDHK